MKSLIRYFSEKQTLATLILIMVLFMGLGTFLTLRKDIYPAVDLGMISITTVYPGASAEDVELNVTNRIEKELKNIQGIKKISSLSLESISRVIIELDDQVADKNVKQDIIDGINRINDFPEGLDSSPKIIVQNSTDIPILTIGVSGKLPYKDLKEYSKSLEKKIMNIQGVNRVEKNNFRLRQIKVDADPVKMKQFEIPYSEIVSAVQNRNIRTTAGNIKLNNIENQLIIDTGFKTPEAIGDVIIRNSYDGPSIKLRDVAVIRDEFEEAKTLFRIDGKPVVALTPFKSEKSDIVATAKAINKLIEQERLHRKDIIITTTTDYSSYVENRFLIMRNNAIMGLILVILILSLFIDLRTSLWVAMGIPFSIMGTVALLPLFGKYLDSVTLSALIMVIGIIVDDAIIISENIYVHREKGKTPIQSVIDGVSEIAAPVLATVFTTIIVFIPMLFIEGSFGSFVEVIPITITIALLISLLESLFCMPAHILPILKKRNVSSSGRKWFVPVQNSFSKLLGKVLKLRYLLLFIFVLVLFFSGYAAVKKINFKVFPSDMAQRFYIMFELPAGATVEETSLKATQLETIIESLPDEEIASYSTTVGKNLNLELEMPNHGYLGIDLTPFNNRKRTADQIADSLRNITEKLTDFKAVNYFVESGGPPSAKPVSIQVIGNDDFLRNAVADSVFNVLKSTTGVKNIERNDSKGKKTLGIFPDYRKISELGITSAEIASGIRMSFDGIVLTSVRFGDEDVDFILTYNDSDRNRMENLKNLGILNKNNRLIPLSLLAEIRETESLSVFQHYDGERTITLEADIDEKISSVSSVTDRIFSSINTEHDYPGIVIKETGEMLENKESMITLTKTFIISILAVYFILVLLYNSLTKPFIVMMAIPFALIGVIFVFISHGLDMSFFSSLGIIALVGMVVNDSLVLVSHVEDLRKEFPEKSLFEIVRYGTTNRLRSIVMTTLTTVVGLLPLAYGIGGSDSWMAPMAMAIGYGLMFATTLTLFFIPCLYLITNDIKKRLM